MWIKTRSDLINTNVIDVINIDGGVVKMWSITDAGTYFTLIPDTKVIKVDALYNVLVDDLKDGKRFTDYTSFLEESKQ